MKNVNYLDIEKLSKLIHYSKSAIYKMIRLNKIPHHRLPNGRTLLFDPIEIDTWIKVGSSSVSPLPKLPKL